MSKNNRIIYSNKWPMTIELNKQIKIIYKSVIIMKVSIQIINSNKAIKIRNNLICNNSKFYRKN